MRSPTVSCTGRRGRSSTADTPCPAGGRSRTRVRTSRRRLPRKRPGDTSDTIRAGIASGPGAGTSRRSPASRPIRRTTASCTAPRGRISTGDTSSADVRHGVDLHQGAFREVLASHARPGGVRFREEFRIDCVDVGEGAHVLQVYGDLQDLVHGRSGRLYDLPEILQRLPGLSRGAFRHSPGRRVRGYLARHVHGSVLDDGLGIRARGRRRLVCCDDSHGYQYSIPFLAPIPLSNGCLTSLISVTRSA